jgi:hypothetical protein
MPEEERTDAALRLVVWTVLYTLAGGVALPIVDADIWWHLRGRTVDHRTRHCPDDDPSPAIPCRGRRHDWLFEVLVCALYQLGGLPGIFVGRCVLTLAVVAAVHRLIAKRLPMGRDSLRAVGRADGAAVLRCCRWSRNDRGCSRSCSARSRWTSSSTSAPAGGRGGCGCCRCSRAWATCIQFIHALLLLGLAAVAR